MKQYDAIIIGAGMGGLAAGVLMAHAGKKVAIVEKNKLNGGRLTSWVHDGFTLDLGVHVISRGSKGPVVQCLQRCGIEPDLKFNTVRPTTSFKGEVFKFPRDVARYVPKKDFDKLMEFMSFIRSLSDEQSHEYDRIPLRDFLNRYTTNAFVHNAVNAICVVYIVVYEDTASTGEFIRCLNWEAQARSSGYPDGGCGSIPREYVKAFESLGGELYNDMPVESIAVENGKAAGVYVNGELWQADMVVSNTGIKRTILELAGEKYFSKDYVEYVRNLTYTESTMIMRVALNKRVTDVKMFSTISETPKTVFRDKLREGIFDKSAASVFAVIPSNFCTGICDDDKQLFMSSAGVPYGISRELEDEIYNYMLDFLSDMFPGFRENIRWIDKSYYQDVDAFAGEDGNCIGIAQCAGQTGADRPKIKTPLEGLYIIGGDAGGSGVGVENAINSAMEFFDTYVNA